MTEREIDSMEMGFTHLLKNNDGGWDLEAREKDGMIQVKGVEDIVFSIEEIEALYHYSQIVKLRKGF